MPGARPPPAARGNALGDGIGLPNPTATARITTRDPYSAEHSVHASPRRRSYGTGKCGSQADNLTRRFGAKSYRSFGTGKRVAQRPRNVDVLH